MKNSRSQKGVAAAELALKAHVLRSNPEILAEVTEGDRMMREMTERVDMTEAPEDAVCSLVIDRPEIDKFRGAIQGDYDHGVFLTTGRFTADAEAASIKKGAISLLLLDGDAIAESMIRNGIGVVRRPVQLFDLDPEFFRFPAADGFL